VAEPFKNLLGPAVVASIGEHLSRAHSTFDRKGFETRALKGLDALEMKARAQHLCDALGTVLPPHDFATAADVMEAALATATEPDDGPMGAAGDGLAGWAVWPMTEYVARHGHADTPRALRALHAMTQRFTGEWAIRPFILREPELSFRTLTKWTKDPSAHVRRLVSEGSRPRLPWGLVLKPLVADPSPTLPLLLALMDDPSPYVRRSVANHLNDIAKDHPHIVEQWLRTHGEGASAQRMALLRHASRTLVKRGHAGVLDALGVGARFNGVATLALSAKRASVGDSIELRVSLVSAAKAPQKLAIDYAVHHVKANGGTSPKVFKGWKLDLAPGASRELVKRHSLKPITTRTYHAGEHVVEVIVNGQALASQAFTLRVG
jgi:3-methyladenine DNA glycosylase AlkC